MMKADETFNYSVPLTPVPRGYPSKERRNSDASESEDGTDLTYLSTPASNTESLHSRLGMDSSADSRMDLDHSESTIHHASGDLSLEELAPRNTTSNGGSGSLVDSSLMSSTFVQFSPSILPQAIHENEAADHDLGDSLVRLGLNTVQVESRQSHVQYVNTVNVISTAPLPRQPPQQRSPQSQEAPPPPAKGDVVPVRVTVPPPKVRRQRKASSGGVVSLMPLPGDTGSDMGSIQSAPTVIGNRSQRSAPRRLPSSGVRRAPDREFALAPNNPLNEGYANVASRAPLPNGRLAEPSSSGVIQYNEKSSFSSLRGSSCSLRSGGRLQRGFKNKKGNTNVMNNLSGSSLPLTNSSLNSMHDLSNNSTSDDVTTRSMPVNASRRLYPGSNLNHNGGEHSSQASQSSKLSRGSRNRRGLGRMFQIQQQHEQHLQPERREPTIATKRPTKSTESTDSATKPGKKKGGLFTKMFSNHVQTEFTLDMVIAMAEEKKRKEQRDAKYGVTAGVLENSGHGGGGDEDQSLLSGRSLTSKSVRSRNSFRQSSSSSHHNSFQQTFSYGGGADDDEQLDSSSRLSTRSSLRSE